MDKTNIFLLVTKHTNNCKLTRSSLPLLVDSDYSIEDDDRFEMISVDKFEAKYGRAI
jgi:hypothetical protein